MIDSKSNFIQKWFFLKGRKVFVGCSGGVDSMVLIYILEKIGTDITALHINYQLRGEESDLDEAFVKNYCQKNKIPCFVHRVDTLQVLNEKGGNLQEVARKIRYEFYHQHLDSYPGSILALGHHGDDQIETFFQHIARKSGVLGLACMEEQTEQMVRPLLTFYKDEIYVLARKLKLTWREDSSNEKSTYTRNFLRNVIIPEIEISIPTIKQSVLLLVSHFQNLQKEITKNTEEIVNQAFLENYISQEKYIALSQDERVEFLRRIGFKFSYLEEVNQLLLSHKGKYVSYGQLKIHRESHGFSFQLNQGFRTPKLITCIVEKLPSDFNKEIIYLDQSKIYGELILRKWQQGDRMKPIGLKGSKLISDILTESKILTSARENMYVLCDDKEIHWCIGLKIGRVALADENTSAILSVKVQFS